ncbi:unnamed protein product [Aspergillus oryzae var. brunneus]|uniref:Unnamed protein product n=1 Tax=Aspergillus oryzae var. brunneus TaxID=332754 RepID=A0ABQ6KP19_ASPOZ|nr:unnamed protein product [Aspergillus oryzae]GMG45274.1 unnamed protein product [Aspergillus oryzae var. brunneus]
MSVNNHSGRLLMRRPAYGIGDSEIWSDRRQVHKSHGLNGNMPSLSSAKEDEYSSLSYTTSTLIDAVAHRNNPGSPRPTARSSLVILKSRMARASARQRHPLSQGAGYAPSTSRTICSSHQAYQYTYGACVDPGPESG